MVFSRMGHGATEFLHLFCTLLSWLDLDDPTHQHVARLISTNPSHVKFKELF
jgi:hypothetical protein